MNNINQFLSEFRNGFQRPGRFICQFFLSDALRRNIQADAALTNSGGNMQQAMRWMNEGWLCNSSRIPDRGFAKVPLSMYGLTEQLPYHTEYADLDCTFLMPLVGSNGPGDNIVPRFFSYWQNQIQHNTKGPEDGLDFAFPGDYYSEMILTLMDTQNRGTAAWKFSKLYPSTSQSVPVEWISNDQFATYNVQFTYSYWTLVPVPDIFDFTGDRGDSLSEAKLFANNPRLRVAVNIGRPLF